MSKTAEDILKELDAVEKMSDDLGEAVAASEEATKVAEEVAKRPVAAPAPVPAAAPPAAPVVLGMKLPLSELLKPAYKPEFSMAAVPASAEAAERPKAEVRREEATAPPAPAGAPVEGAPKAELTSGNRPGVSVLPATGKILENLSGSLDLLMIGIHASIQRARINEQDEQLGLLSMVLANMKKVQNQVDGILGRI